MESMGCLRWLLMLVPMSLLTALGLGSLVNGEPQPLPPTPFTNMYDAAYYYTTQDGTVQFPYLYNWTVNENSPGIASVTNAVNWSAAINSEQLQSGEFVMTIFTPAALNNFGASPFTGVGPVIDFFTQMQAPAATYSAPVPLTIGGRDALRVDIVNPEIPLEIQFYAYALQPDRVAVVSVQTLPGEGFLVEGLTTGLMERMSYLGDPYYGFATPTFPPMDYPTVPPNLSTPFPTITATEVLPDTVIIAGVEAAGDIKEEAVVMRFNGNALMGNWSLRYSEYSTFYSFPALLMYGGTEVRVHSGPGIDGSSNLYAGYGVAQFESGSTIYLYDSSNRLMDTFVVP